MHEPSMLDQRRTYAEVMELFRRRELRHGSSGKIVESEAVARAIAARLSLKPRPEE